MSAIKYWIWLACLENIGAVTAGALLSHFGTPERVYSATEKDYKDVQDIKSVDVRKLMSKSLDKTDKILASCSELGYRILTLNDAEYPDRLRNIYNAPLVLYIKGKLPSIDDRPVVAIVGTRNCTQYGISSAESIGYELSRHGIIVISGLARGIDSAAMRGALRGDEKVLAVIGSGIDVIYPPENKKLYDDIAAHGAIISEYPPGTPPSKGNFPARNRIVSGLSLGVLVIEAPKRSGALITASQALEQGRDVFTLPGNVNARTCEGSNALLREGATPILSAKDIIEEYSELFPSGIGTKEQQTKQQHNMLNGSHNKKVIDNTPRVTYIDVDTILKNLSGHEKTIVSTIGINTLHIDEIIVKSGLTAQQVLSTLTILEINGYTKCSSSKQYEVINQKLYA